jgi:hypothetical protein
MRFAVTYDYRCPFARNAHEHIVAALEAGAPWEVDFLPFSLDQSHAEEGESPVFGDPKRDGVRLATEAGIVVKKRYPDLFLTVHLGLFRARHDEAKDLTDEQVVREVLSHSGLASEQVDAVIEEAGEPWPLEERQKTHERLVLDHEVFGVPTFINENRAVFVRLMTRPSGNATQARQTIELVLDLLDGHPELNEFKATTIPR